MKNNQSHIRMIFCKKNSRKY